VIQADSRYDIERMPRATVRLDILLEFCLLSLLASPYTPARSLHHTHYLVDEVSLLHRLHGAGGHLRGGTVDRRDGVLIQGRYFQVSASVSK
jgi:hypothetical protein